MLNFSNAKRTIIAMTGGILSSLMISTPVLAEAKVIFQKYVSDCTIFYSGTDNPAKCRQYAVTYDPSNETYGHHFIFDSSGRRSIMLFSPEFSMPERREAMFKITGILINNDGEKVTSRGNGRCKLNTSVLNCNFYDFQTQEMLNVNVKF